MMNEKLALNKLQIKVSALESVLNDVGAYIYTKDLQGNYTFCNQPLLVLFNKTLEQVVGKHTREFYNASSTLELSRNDQRVMQEDITLETEDLNSIRGIADDRFFRTVKKPLHDEQGRVIGMCGISTDITEQKKYEAIIKEQKQLLDAVLDNVDAHIYMKDNNRTVRYANRKVAEFLAMPVENIIGQKDTELKDSDTAQRFWSVDQEVLENKEKHVVEEQFENKDGTTEYYHCVRVPYQIDEKTPAMIGFTTDISELYRLKEELQKQAHTDSLTGLHNRRYWLEHTEQECSRSKRHKRSLAVLTLDIDNFKWVNDNFGHPIGDKALVSLSQTLKDNVRAGDILARTGGEEFSICLPDTDIEQALIIAERIREAQEKQIISGEWGELQITLSIGIAVCRSEECNFDILFSQADMALYSAKNSGKNQVCVAA